HVSDNEYELQTLIHRLKNQYDFILTTGGVSVGDYDFIRPVALEQGFEQIFWKVKQKPGKPMLFAKYRRDDQGYCYLLGLPGNPADPRDNSNLDHLDDTRSEEHTSELQSREKLVCRLLLEKKNKSHLDMS